MGGGEEVCERFIYALQCSSMHQIRTEQYRIQPKTVVASRTHFVPNLRERGIEGRGIRTGARARARGIKGTDVCAWSV